jgi:hypothetical protein
MIKHKICDDGDIEFSVPAGSAYLGEFGDKLTLTPKELMELGKEVQDAKFDWCKKFKCRLDAPKCF